MRKDRGFRMKHKWCFWKTKPSSANHHHRQSPSFSSCTRKTVFEICDWFKGICSTKSAMRYNRLNGDRDVSAHPPKGHLVVYVGESDYDKQQYMVPVVYVNHPLFGGLLKEAEKVFGFNHSGGIQIPCRVSEFETVRSMIASGKE